MLDFVEQEHGTPAGLQPLDSFLTDAFLSHAADALAARGFVSDEHEFAPYRETITHYVRQIEQALRSRGMDVALGTGKVVDHPDAGYSYFIYDKGSFPDVAAAGAAVSRWLSALYADNTGA